MEGGGNGKCGLNTWIKRVVDKKTGQVTERRINIGGKATVTLSRLDSVVIETPGGGAWGKPGDGDTESPASNGGGGVSWEHGNVKGSLAERQSAQLGA